ncbi:hypothetical protein BP6252_11899 [Coleophoma cylindrospora]|uniref:Fumarylacetoacetase n=1 Tax=Coleophoma cylindrospora TaxID=1849047 RepID=A0A3D8QKV7_9HELO|nr:hypothetical protein BP6252_11899 [Coleophoma cylindrospora]
MSAQSWLPIDPKSQFSLQNIPFGIISTTQNPKLRPAVAIGDHAFDLMAFASAEGFKDLSPHFSQINVFSEPTLNAFAGLGRPVHRVVRLYLQEILTKDGKYSAVLERNIELHGKVLLPLKHVQTHLPMFIGDYTDFYAGKNHAYNIGVMFRGPANALQPNYTHLPVAYHGRASSVVVSGTPIKRPSGQILLPGTKEPIFSPSKKLDIELELAAFICTPNEMGQPINVKEADQHIFGLVLMNDWSARDIQAWEYVPLGPFLSKNFGTTISPWVVLIDALEPFLAQGLEPGDRDNLLEYLQEGKRENIYDIKLEVDLTTPNGGCQTIAKTNATNLLYSYPQMIAHHTIGGCAMRTGDLLGSGTISGLEVTERGALLEMNENGKVPVKLNGGEERMFLEDGDMINIRGFCGSKGAYVGFGDCSGKIIK